MLVIGSKMGSKFGSRSRLTIKITGTRGFMTTGSNSYRLRDPRLQGQTLDGNLDQVEVCKSEFSYVLIIEGRIKIDSLPIHAMPAVLR